MKSNEFYKQSKVNGEIYMQIWERGPDGTVKYVLSLGSAAKCRKLVEAIKEPAQTK